MSRRSSEKITFRLTPEERGEIKTAIAASADAWKGVSYFVHRATVEWARRVLADQLAFEVRQKNAAKAGRASAKRRKGRAA